MERPYWKLTDWSSRLNRNRSAQRKTAERSGEETETTPRRGTMQSYGGQESRSNSYGTEERRTYRRQSGGGYNNADGRVHTIRSMSTEEAMAREAQRRKKTAQSEAKQEKLKQAIGREYFRRRETK